MSLSRAYTTTALTHLSLMLALTGGWAAPALANPEGGVVAAGSAVISSNGNKLDVHQSSHRAVIDWRSFNIGADEHTQFHQPSANAIALNRVNDANPSAILGKLSANGNVVLINPNGVFFGKDSVTDVNGLVATSADINNDAFMNGSLHFDKPGNADATIINEGHITAKEAGLVGLVAPNVLNAGVIEAKLGRIQLAGGDTVTVDMYGDGLLEVAVSDDVESQFVGNVGTLDAAGGQIAMTASAGKDIVNSLVVAKGELKAPAVAEKSGKITIFAEGSNAVSGNNAADKGIKTGSSSVIVQAALDVSGRNDGERGGAITVTGDEVSILNGTIMDASGHSGTTGTTDGKLVSDVRDGSAGGDIRIGGDYLGQGETATARNLFVDTYTLFYNDALDTGDAGRTIFWSDNDTVFRGNVYARGGLHGGNGGFLETSGHHNLVAQGWADLTAANGKKGTYFLDPTNIIIYGNVNDLGFTSTDGTIDLSEDLVMQLDGTDPSTIELTYTTDALSGATISGTSGTNTLTTSTDISGQLSVGTRIRLGGAGTITTADTVGSDTYTITGVTGTTLTIQETLSQTYGAGTSLYRGLISNWEDKSGNLNDAVGVAGQLPVYDAINNRALFSGGQRMNVSTVQTGTLFVTGKRSSNINEIWFQTTGGQVGSQRGFSFLGPHGQQYYMNESAYVNSQQRLHGNYAGTLDTELVMSAYDDNAPNGSFAIGYGTPGFARLNGFIDEFLIYDTVLSAVKRNLIEQYQHTKWNVGASVADSAAEATAVMDASTGASGFTTDYLEYLSESADISLQATNNITFDLRGDTLALDGDKNLTLNAGNNIVTTANSAGTIQTTRLTTGGNIEMIAGNDIDLHNIVLKSGGGDVTLTATAGNVKMNTINSGTGNLTVSGHDVSIYGGGYSNMEDLVGFWRFDDGSGTLVRDYSGNGNDGSIVGGATWSLLTPNGPADNNGSMDFNGSNGYITVADSDSLDLTDGFTFSLWMKSDNNAQTNRYLLSKRNTVDNDNVYSIIYGYSADQTQFYAGGGHTYGYPNSHSNIAVGDTNWHHMTYSYDGSFFKTFKDGALVNSTTMTADVAASTSVLLLGTYNGGGYFFDGQMDDVRMYNSALSEGDVAMLAGAQTPWLTGNTTINATNDVYFHFRGDEMTLSDGKELSVTAGNNINILSDMSINTRRTGGGLGQRGHAFLSATNDLNIDGMLDFNVQGNAPALLKGNNVNVQQKVTSTGTLNFIARDMDITADISATNLYIRPDAPDASTSLGLAGGAGDFQLTNTELDYMTANNLYFGMISAVPGYGAYGGTITAGARTWNNGITGSLFMRADVGGIHFVGDQNFNAASNHSVRLYGNQFTINGDLSNNTSKSLSFTGSSATLNIGEGVNAAGIDDNELDLITDGWSSIAFGGETPNLNVYAYDNWRDPFSFRANFQTTILGEQRAATGSNATAAIYTGYSAGAGANINANIDLSDALSGNILFDGFAHTAFGTHNLSADLISGSGGITLNRNLNIAGTSGTTRTLDAGTGTMTINNNGSAISFGDRNLDIIADNANLQGNISGTGTLSWRTATDERTIGLGSGSGLLNIDAAEMARLSAGKYIFGATNAGAININTAHDFSAADLEIYGNAILFNSDISAQSLLALSETDITLNGDLSASDTGIALTLSADDQFINNAGTDALSAANGRWHVYSANPSGDTAGGLVYGTHYDFRRFSCSYAGGCATGVVIPGTGDGFFYANTPTLTATPDNIANVTYGDGAPSLTNYAYSVTGFLDALDNIVGGITGSLNGSTGYQATSNAGTSHDITHASGSLVSAMGYDFTYAMNNAAFGVNKATLQVGANDLTMVQGSTPVITYNYSGFKNSQTLATSGVTGTPTPIVAPASRAPGLYDLDLNLSGLSSVNYLFTAALPKGELTVNPAPSNPLPPTVQQSVTSPPAASKEEKEEAVKVVSKTASSAANVSALESEGKLEIKPEIKEKFNLCVASTDSYCGEF